MSNDIVYLYKHSVVILKTENQSQSELEHKF